MKKRAWPAVCQNLWWPFGGDEERGDGSHGPRPRQSDARRNSDATAPPVRRRCCQTCGSSPRPRSNQTLLIMAAPSPEIAFDAGFGISAWRCFDRKPFRLELGQAPTGSSGRRGHACADGDSHTNRAADAEHGGASTPEHLVARKIQRRHCRLVGRYRVERCWAGEIVCTERGTTKRRAQRSA